MIYSVNSSTADGNMIRQKYELPVNADETIHNQSRQGHDMERGVVNSTLNFTQNEHFAVFLV